MIKYVTSEEVIVVVPGEGLSHQSVSFQYFVFLLPLHFPIVDQSHFHEMKGKS